MIGLVFGFAIWTLAEYVLHVVLHCEPFWSHYHKHHHDFPLDDEHGPGWFAQLIIVLSIGGCFTLWSLWIAIGFMLGYVAYAVIHRMDHHVTPSSPSFIDFLQDTHIEHHFLAGVNFGVTVPFWDMLFRTYHWPKNRNRNFISK